nr:hypothetical protein CFP56_35291 [Quercus suber]
MRIKKLLPTCSETAPTASSFWAEANCPSHLRCSFVFDTTEWLKLNACSSDQLSGKNQQWATYFLFGIWNLWLFQNKRLFAKPSPFNLRKAVENQTAEYFYYVLDHAPVTRVKRITVGWTKPQPMCANRLARLGTDMEESFVIFDAPPPIVVSLLTLEKLGTTQDRMWGEWAD